MASLLSPLSELPKKGNIAENWRQWRQNFEIYLIAAQINQKDDNTMRALFLHTIGQYGRDIYNDITSIEPLIDGSLQELFNIFENHCNPKSNVTYNRYKFFHTNQAKNEPFEKFLSSLQRQSKDCEFGELNSSLLVTQIISGIKNVNLRERLLKTEMNLNEVIEECRTSEKSEMQAQQMNPVNTTKPQSVQVKPKQDKKPINKGSKQANKEDGEKGIQQINNCKFCGGSHLYRQCPAFGKVCKKCNIPNHLANVCKT